MSHDDKYIFRTPLLDLKQQVVGYRLALQKKVKDNEPAEVDERALLNFVSENLRDIKAGQLFMDASPAMLSSELLQALAQTTTVLIMKSEDMTDGKQIDLAATLAKLGLGLALTHLDLTFMTANSLLLSQTTHILVPHDHPELQKICSYARQRSKPLCMIVEGAPGWRELEDSAAMGACGFFGNLCLADRQSNSPAKLAPQAQQILYLMQMVQGNADIRHLEKVLKSDVTLSYKLLRYINSAGFGLEVEIESPRHAVAMLGYAPLFRWLLLLLGRTNTAGVSPALMQAAMVRGRFAELLGQGFLSRREAENLFLVGMFSFLDRLLGIPVKEVASQLELPQAVLDALESRKGLYAPVLALAEACENEDSDVATLANGLDMTPLHVNHSHILAIAWVQGIKL